MATTFAIIKGVALNNDGGDKVGYTAPSVEGRWCYRASASVCTSERFYWLYRNYGTGTVGDPMEIAALKRVFGRSNAIASSQ